jgi:hypothetical protein
MPPEENNAPVTARRTPASIRIGLVGNDTATAAGLTVVAHSPVLAMCRRLVAAGDDPATPLEAYRGPMLCLRVRSIGEGAALTVRENPRLALDRYDVENDDVGSRIAQNRPRHYPGGGVHQRTKTSRFY